MTLHLFMRKHLKTHPGKNSYKSNVTLCLLEQKIFRIHLKIHSRKKLICQIATLPQAERRLGPQSSGIDHPHYGTYYVDHVNRRTQYENPVHVAKGANQSAGELLSDSSPIIALALLVTHSLTHSLTPV